MPPRLDPSRILITGIGGSGASYLAEYLLQIIPDVALSGTTRWHSTAVPTNLAHLAGRITTYEMDLLDVPSIVRTLQASKPEWVYALAAQANPKAAFATPTAVMVNNIVGTINLFEAIRLVGEPYPLIQLCSSSEVYGQAEERVVTEQTRFAPRSPYGVSKATQDHLGLMYGIAYHLPIIRTRAFTYLNPRRADLFATAFARQVARIELGKQMTLTHGNLDSVRTMFDVRDCVRAYYLAMRHGVIGQAYNIAGTVELSVGEVLYKLISLATIPILCEVDPALLRPADIAVQTTDSRLFHDTTGFTPEIGVEESLLWLLDYWREKERE